MEEKLDRLETFCQNFKLPLQHWDSSAFKFFLFPCQHHFSFSAMFKYYTEGIKLRLFHYVVNYSNRCAQTTHIYTHSLGTLLHYSPVIHTNSSSSLKKHKTLLASSLSLTHRKLKHTHTLSHTHTHTLESLFWIFVVVVCLFGSSHPHLRIVLTPWRWKKVPLALLGNHCSFNLDTHAIALMESNKGVFSPGFSLLFLPPTLLSLA